ncbi:cell wall metabolism sensor histidine kinase WalK [Azoarcus sp. KH32C]|uniref:sensor histidine kinase n=1 Tax=Azoarcus sp. KH32C TaxID=748247 RepID=UPI00023862E8|nr:ATP-binding protein [Azoarcus sp. KH32C]BAL25722.1 two-component sensor kinase [Azoarcus sp. KH32C]
MPPRPLGARLRAWLNSPFHRFAVVLPAAIALIVGALFYPLFREAEGHIRDEVRAAIALEISGLEEHYHERGLPGLREVLQRRIDAAADQDAVYLLTDRDGKPVIGNLPEWPAGARVADESWFHVREADGSILEGQVFLLYGGDRLLVGRHSPLESFQQRMAWRMWGSAVLIILVAGVIGWFFMQHLHRRLERLALEAGRIQEGHLSQRLSLSPRDDELDVLARRFNTAFDEIERLVDAAKHVSSAIAHDMRRPLIALRQAVDQASEEGDTDPRFRARLKQLGAHTDELLRTFAALLSLARIEAGAHGPKMQEVDLSAIVHDAIDLYEPVADAQGRELVGRCGPAAVRGDPDLLFQVLQNLIENALKYGAGTIEVSVGTDATRQVVLRVRDHGNGVADSDLPRLFERFYRADASRSAPDGAGVGLALVKGIAEAHGGSASAQHAWPGLAVEVVLPAAGEAVAVRPTELA